MVGGVASSLRDLTVMGPRFWAAGMIAKFGREKAIQVPVGRVGVVHVRTRDSDFTTLRQVFRDKEYELDVPEATQRIQRIYEAIVAAGKTPIIIDAGANIGAAARWFKDRFPKAFVIAIEPDPGNAAILARNCGEGMRMVEAAIGGERGHVAVVKAGRSWATQTKRDTEGCPIVTVGDLAGSVPNGALFIVKIDIEGFESDLFSTAVDWLDDAPVVMVEPHDWMTPGTSRNFQTEFGRRDFDLFIKGENLIYVRRS